VNSSAYLPLRRTSGHALGRLIALALTETRWLLAGTIVLIVGAAMSLLYPQGVRIVINGALAGANRGLLDRTALAMAGLSLLFGLALGARSVCFSVAGERIVARLREQVYRRILDQELAFFDAHRTGELISRLTSDTTVVQNAVSSNVSKALFSLAQALGALAFLTYTSARLTLLMLAVVPAMAFSAVTYGRRQRRLARDVQDALADATEVAEETIAGIRTVRAFAAEPAEGSRYARALGKAMALARGRIIAGGTFMTVASFSSYAAAALVFWYGGRLVLRDQISVGQLASFLMYTHILAFSLGGLGDLWTEFMRAIGAAERVFELIDREPTIPFHGGETPARADGAVTLAGVCFSYPTRAQVTVLDEVDLRIEAGELVALVGPSGSGKSTVASLLLRFYDPLEGRVLLDGRDVRALDPRWLRAQVGTVAQEPVLFSTSVAENIRYGRPSASDAEVEVAARAANAHTFVSQFPQGYQTLVGERGVQLSGGQKQRVAIARAVLKNPRLLILDEATSALDSESEHAVREALERLMRGRTTLIIAHRLATVVGADRVVVLDRGRIVQSGPHARLVAEEGLYRRLMERQHFANESR
jgi:ABC transporter fused permease/ATP-binding protein